MLEIGFVVVSVLEQAGGLHGIIRWFKLILGVFLFLANMNDYAWLDVMNSILLDVNTCKQEKMGKCPF